MTMHSGACHCGGVTVEFETAVAPADTQLRACGCSFCRMHQGLAVSDPAGQVTFREAREDIVNRYCFALGTADFLVCRSCGAYVGAVLAEEGKTVGILNVRLLNEFESFTSDPVPMDYGAEQTGSRIERRLEKWMPAQLVRFTANTI